MTDAAGAPIDATPAREAAPARGLDGAPVTAALLATNAGVFVAQVVLSGHLKYALSVPNELLRWLGANASLWTIADNRFETLVTSCFLHASLLHLAFNLLALWQVGPFLERAIGAARFFPLYVGSGIVASATSAIWGRLFGQTMSVGASGAICGLIGAALVLGLRTEGWKGDLTKGMARWLGLLLVIGLVKNLRGDLVQVDNAAHVGGALAGAIVAASWRRGFTYSDRATKAIVAACAAIVAASALVVYVRDRTDPYLFLDTQERARLAWDAMNAGRCDRARNAMRRALQMDPRNLAMQQLGADIDMRCARDELLGPRDAR